MILRNICIVVCLFLVSHAHGQKLEHIQNEIIIRLAEREVPKNLQSFENTRRSDIRFSPIKGAPLNLYVMTVDHKTTNVTRLIKDLQNDPIVISAQTNKIISQRLVPNDTLYDRQWQYFNTGQSGGTVGADIDAETAWDITTGGTTSTGDEIVVCVVDDGYDVDHEDLIDNLWVNKGEIDGDGIDNDGNGFIDDINGWNFLNSTKDVSPNGSHGSPVAGIIGAKGNNLAGVSGVNWDVKIMPIKYVNQITEVSVLESYSYAYNMRKMYNESDGAKGAFVVSINSSWGIDEGDPDDSPIWCDFYDQLGAEGILSCGATANRNFDIDQTGDLPTACKSDYLISVTNLDHTDTKVTGAGYGRVTIDLGAHGREAYTVAVNNRYSGFGGTSGATPHVAGAIALMYAVPCTELMAISKENPGLAALMIKEILLNTVDSKSGLDGITTSRGRLNLGNAVTRANNLCIGNGDTYGFTINTLVNGNANLSWTANKTDLITDLRYRQFDESNWTEFLNINSGFEFTDLDFCNMYEYQVRSYTLGDTIAYGFSRFFETQGCCFASNIQEVVVNDNTATITLINIEPDIENIFEFRKFGETEWDTIIAVSPVTLTNIENCDLIEYRVSTLCNLYNNSSETTSQLYLAIDCGECTKSTFCTVENFNNEDEWIESISINGENFQSGQGINSYNTFTGGFIPKVKRDKPIPIILEPEHSGQAYSEYFQIFIDLNQDGILDEDTERVYDAGIASPSTVTDTMFIPIDALTGITRMRVMMSFNSAANVCGQSGINYGEIEDYCIEIEESLGTYDNQLDPSAMIVNPNISNNLYNIEFKNGFLTEGKVEIYSVTGVKIHEESPLLTNRFSINATSWQIGTYYIRYVSELGSITKKVIKL